MPNLNYFSLVLFLLLLPNLFPQEKNPKLVPIAHVQRPGSKPQKTIRTCHRKWTFLGPHICTNECVLEGVENKLQQPFYCLMHFFFFFFTRNIITRLAAKSGCVRFPTLRISVSDSSSRKSYVNKSFPVSGMTCLYWWQSQMLPIAVVLGGKWWEWFGLEFFSLFADSGAAHFYQLAGHRLERQIWNEMRIRLMLEHPWNGRTQQW